MPHRNPLQHTAKDGHLHILDFLQPFGDFASGRRIEKVVFFQLGYQGFELSQVLRLPATPNIVFYASNQHPERHNGQVADRAEVVGQGPDGAAGLREVVGPVVRVAAAAVAAMASAVLDGEKLFVGQELVDGGAPEVAVGEVLGGHRVGRAVEAVADGVFLEVEHDLRAIIDEGRAVVDVPVAIVVDRAADLAEIARTAMIGSGPGE